MGVSQKWGTPIAGWFISWKIPAQKWMITRGTPWIGKPKKSSDTISQRCIKSYKITIGALISDFSSKSCLIYLVVKSQENENIC